MIIIDYGDSAISLTTVNTIIINKKKRIDHKQQLTSCTPYEAKKPIVYRCFGMASTCPPLCLIPGVGCANRMIVPL